MRLDDLHGPTIDDFSGIATSRLILGIFVTALVISIAVSAWSVVRAARRRNRRVEAKRPTETPSGGRA
ncbi:hypothetical protein AB4Z18_02790 [Leifsonia sp. 2TAF2]|uniref:hypothetical protein n=1 Tax=Leifsonia sp. 2TAF2 TaxID=3233009 RepID=UPI003F967A23